MVRRHATCVILPVVILLAGCQPKQPSPATAKEAASQPEVAPATAEKSAAPTLEVVDKAGYQQALQSKRGKIVLVDFWATWCGPCKQAFPHTVALYEKYAPQGLAVISVAMDDEDAQADALKFLKEQKATFTNLRSKLGAEAEAFEQFDIEGGGIPHLKLFDREGKLVKTFTTGDPNAVFTPEEIDFAVRELIGKSGKQ